MTQDSREDGSDMDTPVSVEEAVKFLGGIISVKTLYRWAAEGRVPSIKLGGKRCFIRRQLAAWMASQATGTAQ
jgi:excisionase family DNA binding protein